jgi:hypothetical protein
VRSLPGCGGRAIRPGPHQYDMAARVDDEAMQYRADFWPRDHGESEIFCIDYPLRRFFVVNVSFYLSNTLNVIY